MDEETRRDLNGLGGRVNIMERDQAKCAENKDSRIRHLESWTRDQEAKLDDLIGKHGALSLRVTEMSNDIVNKMTARISLISFLMTAVLGAIMLFK